ncbi:MAG: PD40 domain-containing protein [Chitinophagales bacterium]|nr:PD40 domain-containing protein [Chitinophagaceae bacterium]MCB9063560.1 PD40 domain-containing protein [Chitinophagales bacterium]
MKKYGIVCLSILLAACGQQTEQTEGTKHDEDGHGHHGAPTAEVDSTTLTYNDETHFKNVIQLTTGGDNAEAYFGFDSKTVVFQRTNPDEGIECDRIFYGVLPETKEDNFTYKLVSTGTGRTTCSYLMPDGKHFIYSSTHLGGKECPPVPDRAEHGNKYVWPIYDSYDIFIADLNGKIVKQLTNTPGYDAEPVISPKGDKILFTSTRNGDLDLYTMNMDGTDVKQITHELGYDGGAWFSPDGSKIVWRASRPKTPEDVKEYKDLLNQGLVQPTNMEVFIANADGSDVKQVTSLGQANWAPNWMPDGKRIIFASNHEYERGFPFNLYIINADGTGLEKISHDGGFDAFPMFSPDGKRIMFSSNRNNHGTRETNVFIADWVE